MLLSNLSHSPLSILLLLPLIASLVIALSSEKMARPLAIGFSLVMFALSMFVWQNFHPGVNSVQFEQKLSWIQQPLPIEYPCWA